MPRSQLAAAAGQACSSGKRLGNVQMRSPGRAVAAHECPGGFVTRDPSSGGGKDIMKLCIFRKQNIQILKHEESMCRSYVFNVIYVVLPNMKY